MITFNPLHSAPIIAKLQVHQVDVQLLLKIKSLSKHSMLICFFFSLVLSLEDEAIAQYVYLNDTLRRLEFRRITATPKHIFAESTKAIQKYTPKKLSTKSRKIIRTIDILDA